MKKKKKKKKMERKKKRKEREKRKGKMSGVLDRTCCKPWAGSERSLRNIWTSIRHVKNSHKRIQDTEV